MVDRDAEARALKKARVKKKAPDLALGWLVEPHGDERGVWVARRRGLLHVFDSASWTAAEARACLSKMRHERARRKPASKKR